MFELKKNLITNEKTEKVFFYLYLDMPKHIIYSSKLLKWRKNKEYLLKSKDKLKSKLP